MLDGIFHADPHPGNILLLRDGHPGLLDWGSVGRIDAGLRGALQRLLLALDRGDPLMVTDSLLDVVDRPQDLDEPRLERALGRFLARYFAAGVTPDMRMFTDLFRIVTDFGLSVPAEIAAVFRALATIEGTLTQLAPGFDIVDEARRFGGRQLAAQLSPEAIRKTASDELAALVPLLRRLPRRIDRIGGALEDGRLTLSVRLLADPSDRRYLTGLVHQVLLAFLAAASGIMAVLMIGLHGGPALISAVSLYSFLGYCLLGYRGDPRRPGPGPGVPPQPAVTRARGRGLTRQGKGRPRRTSGRASLCSDLRVSWSSSVSSSMYGRCPPGNVEGVARAEDFLLAVGVLDPHLPPEDEPPVLGRAGVVGEDLDERVHVIARRARFKGEVHVTEFGPCAGVLAGLGRNGQLVPGYPHAGAFLLVVWPACGLACLSFGFTTTSGGHPGQVS